MRKKKKIDYSKLPECDVIVNHINKRYSKGLNTNVYVIGLSGTGKSSTSLRTAEKIIESREGNPNVQITDSLLDLLKAIRTSKVGDIVIIEEVSVLFPSRRAMAKENVNIGKIMDTCRKRQLCIISNAPIWKSIDSHMRAMGHLLIETLKINKKEQIVVSKFHRLQTNPLTGKTYRHTMRRKSRDVSRMFTKKPNQETWDAYEKSKDIFMEDLYKRMEFEQNKKKKKQDKEMNVAQPKIRELTPLELQVHNLINLNELSQAQTARHLEKDPAQINRIVKKLREMGDNPRKNLEIDIKNAPIPARK